MGDFTELKRLARAGDIDAINALLQLVEAARGDANAVNTLIDVVEKSVLGSQAQLSIAQVVPSIHALSKVLQDEGRTLSDMDLVLARRICLELSAKAGVIPFVEATISRVPNVMDRLELYKDSHIVIRAHLFHDGANETYIHNHGQAMISTCLEGGYEHKIYQINEVEGKHYKFERHIGGTLGEECAVEAPGGIETTLCQPFDAGQSLFISALAKHTVTGSRDATGRVATITIRDAAKRFQSTQIISSGPTIDECTDPVVPITDPGEQERIKASLQRALLAFRGELVPPPPPVKNLQLDEVEAQGAEILDEVRLLRRMFGNVRRASASQTSTSRVLTKADRALNSAVGFYVRRMCCEKGADIGNPQDSYNSQFDAAVFRVGDGPKPARRASDEKGQARGLEAIEGHLNPTNSPPKNIVEKSNSQLVNDASSHYKHAA